MEQNVPLSMAIRDRLAAMGISKTIAATLCNTTRQGFQRWLDGATPHDRYEPDLAKFLALPRTRVRALRNEQAEAKPDGRRRETSDA